MEQSQIIAILVVIGLVFWIFKAMGQKPTPTPIPKPQPISSTVSDNSKIPISELVSICPQSIKNKEEFAKKYSFTKLMTLPTPGMGEMHSYKSNMTTLYFANHVVIYSSNQAKGSDYIQQATNLGFTKTMDSREADGHIVTYKKGDIQLDFKEPNSTLSLAVYRTKTEYKGNLNGMDYNNFVPSVAQQPIPTPAKNKLEIQYDISKIKETIDEAIEYVNSYTKNTEDLNDKRRGEKGLENIRLLQSKNQVPSITNIDNAVKVLTSYNQNNINLYEYLDPTVVDGFLDVVTEDLYVNKNGGKPELTKLYTEIGMPQDEIPLTAMGCIMKFLAKHSNK